MARFLLPSTLLLALGLLATPAPAQVTPDGTVGTVVTPAGTTFTITGGTTSGSNLFHSFSDFSVPTGGTAYFNNATNIANIFSRVTGGNISNIDGLIQANGTANLFLLNPSGIIFGQNAKLALGGSFFATTADLIVFENGEQFSATDPKAPPPLTVNVPIGLQWNQPNAAPLEVRGNGHRLTFSNPTSPLSALVRSNPDVGMKVRPGNTLALLGGPVNFNGGILAADGGRIELGSVRAGSVMLIPNSAGWALDYSNVEDFGDLQLRSRSLVDVSGRGGGSIQLAGGRVVLSDGSIALNQTEGLVPGGDITVAAQASLEILGTSNGVFQSQLQNGTTGRAPSGSIFVSTQRLVLENGGQIFTASRGVGAGGKIVVNASESIRTIGVAPRTGSSSIIGAVTSGLKDAGDIEISTRRFTAIDGAGVSSSTFGLGSGGNVTINATESIELVGINPVSSLPGGLGSSTFAFGDAGTIVVNTGRLSIREGARIGASSLAFGNAGSVIVNATEFIDIQGNVVESSNPSLIISSANALNPVLQRRLGLPSLPSGDSGDVTVNTPELRVGNGARLTVANQGTGNAGNLRVNAEVIRLNDDGAIIAATRSGEGGNLTLTVGSSLLLRNGSQISATAGGSGNGGNITINAPFIVAVPGENSDIIANAFRGRGGNIQISTQSLFGLAFRPQLTPNSDITASSQFGVNGIVAINNPDVDPSSSLAELPEDVTDPSNQIESGCAVAADNRFTVTGRGGLPPNPTELLRSTRTWSDVRDLSEFRSSKAVEAEAEDERASAVLVEATGWAVDEAGRVVLVAMVPHGNVQANAINCTGAIQ